MTGPLETAGFWNQVFVTIGCPFRVRDNDYITSEVGALMARALWCMVNGKQWHEDMEITYDDGIHGADSHTQQSRKSKQKESKVPPPGRSNA